MAFSPDKIQTEKRKNRDRKTDNKKFRIDCARWRCRNDRQHLDLSVLRFEGKRKAERSLRRSICDRETFPSSSENSDFAELRISSGSRYLIFAAVKFGPSVPPPKRPTLFTEWHELHATPPFSNLVCPVKYRQPPSTSPGWIGRESFAPAGVNISFFAERVLDQFDDCGKFFRRERLIGHDLR